MKWRDLLYFSKGERRALALLLSLIATAWLVLICTDPVHPPTTNVTSQDTTVRFHSHESPSGNKRKEDKKQTGQKTSQTTKPVNTPLKKTDTLFKRFPKTEKFPEGTLVELNTADTVTLKKVPGIGSAFANRIVKYRNLLGGFYTVEQLTEVYGIDEERYEAMKSWFSVDLSAINQLKVNQISAKNRSRHPYVSYKQALAIEQLVRKKGKLTGWEELSLLEEFTESDRNRLEAYLSFQ